MKKQQKNILIVAGVIGLLVILGIIANQPETISATPSKQSIPYTIYKSLSVSDMCSECAGDCKVLSGGDAVCCEISGWTLCNGDTDCCPPVKDCSDDPSQMPDCSEYCSGGNIIDYSADVCCPKTNPFYGSLFGGCQQTAYPDSDNYFTRNSECFFGRDMKDNLYWEESCSGNYYKRCVRAGVFGLFEDGSGFGIIDGNYFFKWSDPELVAGKCGVNCLQGDEKCDGQTYYQCGSSYTFENKGLVDGKCGYINPVPICQDTVNQCGGACPPCNLPQPFNYDLIIGAVVGILVIVAIILYLRRRK